MKLICSLFITFLKIGAFTFGGGYAMIALVRETVLSNGWLTENEFLNFIAVSESKPGPPCREYGNLYRLNTGRNPRFICYNAGRGVAVIFDYSLNCIRTKESDEICTCQRLFIGSSSVRCSDDPCDRAQHGAVYAVWPHRFTGRICARFALYRSVESAKVQHFFIAKNRTRVQSPAF